MSWILAHLTKAEAICCVESINGEPDAAARVQVKDVIYCDTMRILTAETSLLREWSTFRSIKKRE